jgi:hypothetical protein
MIKQGVRKQIILLPAAVPPIMLFLAIHQIALCQPRRIARGTATSAGWPTTVDLGVLKDASNRYLFFLSSSGSFTATGPLTGPLVEEGSSWFRILHTAGQVRKAGLLSERYVIREIAIREENPPESFKTLRNWGLVLVFEFNQHDFSVTTKNQKMVVIFSNQFAPNLDRMEIVGVSSIEQLMQAIAID